MVTENTTVVLFQMFLPRSVSPPSRGNMGAVMGLANRDGTQTQHNTRVRTTDTGQAR